MEVRDVSLFDLTVDPGVGSQPPAVSYLDAGGDGPALADLAEADRLIFDLTALVEAGLIEVREPVFGPARYGVPHRDEGRLRLT